MTIVSSGEIGMDDIVLEFSGDTPHGLFEYYRSPTGPYVTENNTDVPLSGTITFEDFYSSERVYTVIVSTGTTNLVLDSLFTSAQKISGAPLKVIINSGVVIGSNDASLPSVRTGTDSTGTMTLVNNGYIYAAGGGLGVTGGTALKAEKAMSMDNTNGRLWGGGGGGGNGGRAGDRFTKNYFEGTGWRASSLYSYYSWIWEKNTNMVYLSWGTSGYGECIMESGCRFDNPTAWHCNLTSGGGQVPLVMARDEVGFFSSSTTYWYERGPVQVETGQDIWYDIRRFQHVAQTATITPGGVGQGFNHNWGVGSTGSYAYNWDNAIATWSDALDTTAPYTTRYGQLAYTKDGNGGAGGDWGQPGVSGVNGTNGIVTNGQAGQTAGAAGKYAEGNSSITWIAIGDRKGTFSA